MFNRLSVRLSLAFLLSAWIGVGAMMLVVQRTLDAGFRQYVISRESEINPEQITQLEAYYAANGTWAGAETQVSGRGLSGSGGNGAGAGEGGRGATYSIVDLDGVIVSSTDATLEGTLINPALVEIAHPLAVDGVQVGWLYRASPGIQALGAAEMAFLDESNRWLLFAGLGATVLALLVGVILAYSLARPLRELTTAVRDLSVGQWGRQVDVRGTVEVNALTTEFNTMSQALAEAETLRQRMAADVAHELRTPVTVLRGHLEAMLDGVYPLDSAHVAVAHDQTLHLARLVEDLRVLTLAEAKRLPLERTVIHPAELINQFLEAFEPLMIDGNIRLIREIAPDLPAVTADVTRIRQVISNLLTNALRHTPTGGEIAVRVSRLHASVRFSVSNTGSHLSDTDAAHVFQPFWRADTAREQGSGSGLGLAISREIIALHDGTLTVESSDNRVTFAFTLPIGAFKS
ncbi:MAG: HAMP domain-containing protein [Pleurocapsa minor GSE-CHR-MK-17-07R]|jgi:signal transduction histidine kinase|nr:HAMP domain-containing protein [Pleurocapsa minor GSE-CHR-MK 17-07R]